MKLKTNHLKTILLSLVMLYQAQGFTQVAIKINPFTPVQQAQKKMLSQIVIDPVTGDDKINLAEVLAQQAYITGRVEANNVNRAYSVVLKFGRFERSVSLASDKTFKYLLSESDYLYLYDGNLTIYASFRDNVNDLSGTRNVEITAVRPAKVRSVRSFESLAYSPALLPQSNSTALGLDYEPNTNEWHFSGFNGVQTFNLNFNAQGIVPRNSARYLNTVNLETGWGGANRTWRHGKIRTQVSYFASANGDIQYFNPMGLIKSVYKMPMQISSRIVQNPAMHLLALSPDGNILYAMLSSSLQGDESNMIRIIAFDRSTNLPIKQYAYKAFTPNGREARISSILSVDNDKLLVLESETSDGSINGVVQHTEKRVRLIKLANPMSTSDSSNLNRNSATILSLNNAPLFAITLRSDGSSIFDYKRFPSQQEILLGGITTSNANSDFYMSWGPQLIDGSESLILVNPGSQGFQPYALTLKVRP